MEAGTYISGVGHVALISWAIFGGTLFPTDPKPQMQVADVTVVSVAAFEAMISRAPDAATNVTALSPPDQSAPRPPSPTADVKPQETKPLQVTPPAKQDARPDLKAVKNPPRARVQINAPQPAEPPLPDQVGATLIAPIAPIARRDQNGRRQPDRLALVAPAQQAAPKVDTQAAPKPPTDAVKAKQAQKATSKDSTAKNPVKPSVAKAPDQTSTEIITEAKQSKKSVAPLRSSRPKGRPAAIREKARVAKEIALAMAQVVKDASAAATPAPPAAQLPIAAPVAPKLTGAEIEGLRLAVKDCWNVGAMSTDAMRITVVVGVALARDGRPVASSLRMISATAGSATATRDAYETASRAIRRCGAKGFDLPIEKYQRWKNVEITFNPEKMRNK